MSEKIYICVVLGDMIIVQLSVLMQMDDLKLERHVKLGSLFSASQRALLVSNSFVTSEFPLEHKDESDAPFNADTRSVFKSLPG